MKVSLVIPVYNEEKYLQATLLAIKNQTVRPDEIIVVDNNSTDRTIEVVNNAGLKIEVISEKQQGMTFARNAGFNAAKYEVIVRVDADTIPPPDWIKRIKEDFERYPIDGLTGPVYFSGTFFKSTFYAKLLLAVSRLLNGGHNVLFGPNMVIKKTIWEKIKFHVCTDNKKVHEDIDLAIHIKKAGGRIMVDNSLVVAASDRRIKNDPLSFFTEYPVRFVKTFLNH